MEESTTPVTTRMTTVQVVADRKSRSASELRRIAGRCENIPKSAHGLDHVDPELLSDTADAHFYSVGVAIECLIVEVLDKLAARDHAAGMMHQIRKQTIFMRGKLDRIAIHADPPRAGIEANGAAIEFAPRMPGGAAQERTNAGKHLFEVERLGHVIVRTGIEALHLVAPSIAGGEHQDGHGPACPTPSFQNRDAVHLGQADIQNDRVIRLDFAEVMPFLAVEGAIDDVAGIAQSGRKLPVKVGIVLDHEQTQGEGPPRTPSLQTRLRRNGAVFQSA